MALETIYNAETPGSTDAVAGTARMLGMKWDTSATGKVVTGGRVWIPATGLEAGMRWQLWEAPSTLLQDILLDGHSGTPDSWMPIVGVTTETITQSQDYYVTFYIPSTSGGDYVFSSSGGPITSGSITASNIFKNGGTSAQPPDDETFTGGLFFVDIDLNDEAAVQGVLAVVLPALDAELDGELTASGILNAIIPALDAEFDGELSAAGVLNIVLPALDAEFDGELGVSGVLNAVVPSPEFDEVGLVTVEGSLNIVLPALDAEFDGQLPVSGVLNIVLPAFDADFDGTSAAGGATVGPCGWTIPDPLCCPDWAGTDAAIKSAAADYAATILWAATGRQFGLCEVTVRPCGMRRCPDGGGEFWGYDQSGGTWVPYIFNGQWFNCGCGPSCCCEPHCQVRLMGPVNSIVEVTIGGIAVDPDTYRVDDNHWLVRTAGECWPQCADLDTDDGDNVFEVTYMRGDPVPNALLRAASTVECEWAKACTGGDCRLSNRVTSVARSGITIDMVDPNQLLESGLTGMWEVDTVIRAFNPDRLNKRLKIWAPELNVPRTVTSP